MRRPIATHVTSHCEDAIRFLSTVETLGKCRMKLYKLILASRLFGFSHYYRFSYSTEVKIMNILVLILDQGVALESLSL